MERLIKIGKIKPRKASEIKNSRIGIGFEKLDRKVFNPEKAYDKLAMIGAKWVRIQSGWERTEQEKGVYDFEWLDSIVDNLLERGLVPWINLVYGNGLYDDDAAKVFGAVGCPPVKSEEAKKGWADYITALAAHMKGRISYYEVWNEPDGEWCWKHGPNGKEYGQFVVDTSVALKKGDSSAKVIGGAICMAKPLDFAYDAFSVGMGEHIDAISFHEYVIDETVVFRHVKALRGLCNRFNPNIEIIQGESGSQSRSDGRGAMRKGAWTPHKQAKQLLRHLMADLMTEVKFTSYFSCMDMIEALNGTVGDLVSYLDYGYFGVLGAAVTALIRCIIPTNFKVYIAVSVIGSFVQIPLMCLYGVLLAMVIDYNEYTYYNKMVGVSSGAIGIGTKIGSGVGSVILTACLALGAYNPDLEVATTSMRYAIYAFSNYLPLIINLGLFVLFRFFDLEEKHPNIHYILAFDIWKQACSGVM